MLIKFGAREHMEALRNEGVLFLNTQAYFSRREAGPERADSYEASDRIYQPSDIRQMTVEGTDATGKRVSITIKPEDMAGPVSIGLSHTPSFNIYCLFGVRQPLSRPFVDPRNFAFGDSFVLILDTQKFIDKAAAASSAAGFSCEWRPVEYYDLAVHSGETGPFRKPSSFSHQNEIRFVTSPGLSEPLILSLLPLVRIAAALDFAFVANANEEHRFAIVRHGIGEGDDGLTKIPGVAPVRLALDKVILGIGKKGQELIARQTRHLARPLDRPKRRIGLRCHRYDRPKS